VIPTFEALVVLSYMVVPGFLATHSFNAVVVRETRDTTRMVVEWVAVSMLFWVIIGPIIGAALLASGWDLGALDTEVRSAATSQAKVNALLLFTGVAVIVPVLAGWGLARSVRRAGLEDRLGIRPLHPRAWDELFSRGEAAYVIVTLKNGGKIAGYYGPRSFASSYPNPEDLYLEAVVPLDDDDNFTGTSDEHTAGVWIPGAEVRTLELFAPLEEGHEREEEQQRAQRRLPADAGAQGLSSRGLDGTEEAVAPAERLPGEAVVEHAREQRQQHQDGDVTDERPEASERGLQARVAPVAEGVSASGGVNV